MSTIPPAQRRGGGNGRPAICVLVALLSGLLLLLAGCSGERAAEKAFEQATSRQGERPLEQVRDELRQIVEQWPETHAARKARRELEWVETLLSAEARGPSLLAWDAVREVASAAEKFRLARGRYPAQFSELVPRYLDGAVRDPWGFDVDYHRTSKGYQVVCYGEDGIPGGTGLGTDLIIDTGQVVQGPRTAAP